MPPRKEVELARRVRPFGPVPGGIGTKSGVTPRGSAPIWGGRGVRVARELAGGPEAVCVAWELASGRMLARARLAGARRSRESAERSTLVRASRGRRLVGAPASEPARCVGGVERRGVPEEKSPASLFLWPDHQGVGEEPKGLEMRLRTEVLDRMSRARSAGRARPDPLSLWSDLERHLRWCPSEGRDQSWKL